MKWKPLAVAATVTIIALAMYLVLRPHSSTPAAQPPAAHIISAEGKLEARPGAEMDVGTAMTARIERFLVNEGEHVDKGQVIAELDSQELTARLHQAETELAVAQAKRVKVAAGSRDEEIKQAQVVLQRTQSEQMQAEKEFNRTGQLHKDKFVSQATLDNAESAYKVATARVAEAEEHLRLLRSPPRDAGVA